MFGQHLMIFLLSYLWYAVFNRLSVWLLTVANSLVDCFNHKFMFKDKYSSQPVFYLFIYAYIWISIWAFNSMSVKIIWCVYCLMALNYFVKESCPSALYLNLCADCGNTSWCYAQISSVAKSSWPSWSWLYLLSDNSIVFWCRI